MEGWGGFVILQPSTNLFWVSGYGNLGWRRTTVEMGSRCEVWGGGGWVIFGTCSWCSWLWVVEEY